MIDIQELDDHPIDDKFKLWKREVVTQNDYKMNRYTYKKLLIYLDSYPYRYIIYMDENREVDGYEIRFKFAWYNGIPYSKLDGIKNKSGCTMLEFLIGVAYRISEYIPDWDSEDISPWFWLMIKNLGLDSYDDEHWNLKEVEEKIDRFLNRQFGPYGEGSILTFEPDEDKMTYEEIWRHITRFADEWSKK